jgi:hypothetical protein
VIPSFDQNPQTSQATDFPPVFWRVAARRIVVWFIVAEAPSFLLSPFSAMKRDEKGQNQNKMNSKTKTKSPPRSF